MCCPDGCLDQFDPYRLAPRQPDQITLAWARPDVNLSPGPMLDPVLPVQAIVGLDLGAIISGAPEILEVGVDEVLGTGGKDVLQVGVGGLDTLPGGAPYALGTGVASDVVAVAPPVDIIQPSRPWTAGTPYSLGASVTPTNPVGPAAVGQTFYVFVCIIPGQSGAVAPDWTTTQGTMVGDGTVLWLNAGLYLP